MTTHYQKIQALGNRMASNLETMGVSASFSDGGLTLADKILQIQRFNDGIILYGDKSIAQSSDTINLHALLLDDGKPVSGETVEFVSESALKSLVANGQTSGTLDEDYYVTVTGTGVEDHVQIGSNSSKCIAIASSTIILTLSGSSQAIFYDGNAVNVKNGILTYTDTNNTEQTVDISEYSPYNILNLKSSSGAIFKWYSLYATTGSDGVASKSYACTGAGLKSITAKSGSLQSEPYTVYDCTFKDLGDNPKWFCTQTNVERTANNDEITFTNPNATSYSNIFPYVVDTLPTSWNNKMNAVRFIEGSAIVEFDIVASDGFGGQFYLRFEDGNSTKSIYTGNIPFSANKSYKFIADTNVQKILCYVDGVKQSFEVTDFTQTHYAFAFSLTANHYLTIKNFKIYPI